MTKVFDWDKAARILRDRGAKTAGAGLAEDWKWTGGSILRDGKPMARDDTYTFLASWWATPVLFVDGEEVECWRPESEAPGWDAETAWPESALKIFNGEEDANGTGETKGGRLRNAGSRRSNGPTGNAV